MVMKENILKTVELQRSYFDRRETFDINRRIHLLKRLKESIQAHEDDICAALYKDLGKSRTESYMCEIGLTLSELSYQIKHIRKLSRPKRKVTPLASFHSKSYTLAEPRGCVLILSPWNYPFMLCMEPLIGAVAAGNCCIIQPSADAPETSSVVKLIADEVFDDGHVAVLEGGVEVAAELLEHRFDYIFYTGSVNVGKLVMEKASRHLTPVTLELGGKSPCIITEGCDLKLAAKRLVFGKYLNCGQTCVAPDYVLADRKIKDEFIKLVKDEIVKMYGLFPVENKSYGRIINRRHFDRIRGLMGAGRIVYGGECDKYQLKIAPTIIDELTGDEPIMQEEIFGPLMPVITYDTLDEAETFIMNREKPLALYLFTNDKSIEERFTKYVSYGGGCINDTIVHLATPYMGFGGTGYSGMGSYHGKKSFDTFSHEKSILKKYNWIDLPMRYQPFKEIDLKLIKLFLR